MTKIINLQNIIKTIALIAVAGFFALGTPLFAASVQFNTSSSDCATVRVRNVTQNTPTSGVGPSGCDSLSQWKTGTISANPGDVIAVAVYYHNTGTQTANGTKIKVTTPQNMGDYSSHTIKANVSSSNGGYDSGTVYVNLSESQTLEYITNSDSSGSTSWYDNGNGGPYSVSSNIDQSLFSNTGVLANGDGVVEPNWAAQGTLRMRFRVGETIVPPTPDDPVVVTEYTSSEDLDDVTLHGTIQNFGQASQVWFEFDDQSSPLNNQTIVQSLGGSNNTLSFSAEASLWGNFEEDTNYYYRACGRLFGVNGSQDVCGGVETFLIESIQPNVYECNDGIDNDSDGYTDMQDAGCSSATDNDEYNYISLDEPVAETNNEDEIDEDSIELNGSVYMNSFEDGLVFFVYGQNENDIRDTEDDYNKYTDIWGNEINNQFEAVPVDYNHDGNGDFSKTVNYLESGEEYFYQICVEYDDENNNPTLECGGVENFYTSNSNGGTPDVDTDNEDEVDEDSAELNGSVDMNDFENGLVFFVYGQDESDVRDIEDDYNEYDDADNDERQDQFMVVAIDYDHDNESNFSRTVNNLESDEEYFYQICVEYEDEDNDSTLECGGLENFYTEDESNSNDDINVNTFSAQDVDEDSAELRGDITDIDNESVFRFFEWGTSSSNLNEELTISGSTGSTGEFSRTLQDLDDDRTYYFRACAEEVNSGDTDCGIIRNFRTSGDSNPENEDLSVITTNPTSIGRTSAALNGLAISPELNIESMWFEWGSTVNLGRVTSRSNINASGTRSLTQSISGLSTNTIYYYRVVAEDEDGNIEEGLRKTFRTDSSTVVVNPTNPGTPVVIDVSGEGSLYLALDIEADFENVIVGDTIDYTVAYRNLIKEDLDDVLIQVIFAEETRFIKSTAGFYSSADHNLTVVVGDLDGYEEGEFVVRVEVLRGASGDLIVAQANAGHDHPSIRDAQVGTVPAYALNNVVNDPNRLVGLALFGGAFFPTTFLGWLILLLVIIALVLLARKLYNDREDRNHSHININ
ncbi:MAG: putative repeat protein (TIGR01451 family) [Candidatus Paceibacteria bacterium]|jgi:uncharacterized repeat protein (TIGR01451 family)